MGEDLFVALRRLLPSVDQGRPRVNRGETGLLEVTFFCSGGDVYAEETTPEGDEGVPEGKGCAEETEADGEDGAGKGEGGGCR